MGFQSRVHGKKALSENCFLAEVATDLLQPTHWLVVNFLALLPQPQKSVVAASWRVICTHMLHVNKPKCFWKHWLLWLLLKSLILEKASCKQNRPWLFTNSVQVLPESLLFKPAGVGSCHKNYLKCPEVLYKYYKLSKCFLSHWKLAYLTSTWI